MRERNKNETVAKRRMHIEENIGWRNVNEVKRDGRITQHTEHFHGNFHQTAQQNEREYSERSVRIFFV